jgi:hypothetical protein
VRNVEGSRVAVQEPRKTMVLWMGRHIACMEWGGGGMHGNLIKHFKGTAIIILKMG